MRKLVAFNSVSIDGYFTDLHGDMSWAHGARPDAEFDAFVQGNARGGGMLLFGRITYDMMKNWWPTPMAAEANPVVAERMNAMPKGVFSRTLEQATWANTQILRGVPALEVRRLKDTPGPDMALLGSGSIVAQLANAGLVDVFQMVVVPVALGGGRTMFEGIGRRLALRLTTSRSFANGNVFLTYEPAGS
jgi:dihydrofolate reductase